MFDIDEIRKRAMKANVQATETLAQNREKTEDILQSVHLSASDDSRQTEASEADAQIKANTQRQVEILGQIFGADAMAQMAANEEMMQKMVNDQVAEAAASNAESLMAQFFGEDMGVLAAALETLELEDEEEDEEESLFGPELEAKLYSVLEETMSRIEALPEQENVSYEKNDARWERFGILLSGIVSTLNSHRLDGMDVEAHIPVMEQQIVSIVRRSWGIDGRSGLLDMIRYLSQDGYILRYRIYSEAASPEELMDEDMDEEDRESAARTWRFVQHYKNRYTPGFLAGWDTGRAAMLARWGCYLGWITEGEARGILLELAATAAKELRSWREFAQSYLFGGLMWKMLCGDSSAESYLGYLADAATKLLAGRPEEDAGQWRSLPWPAQRKIGFSI